MRVLIIAALLSGCAYVPPGSSNLTNPSCIWRCYVAPTQISANPSLETLTFDSGDVAQTETDQRTRTITGVP